MANIKKILVTGGAGFIGSHLCERLIAEGHKVFCLDNLMTSVEKNISHLKSNGSFHFIEQDIIKPFYIEEKIDQIYNLACPASPIHYQKNPVRTIKTNTIGMINVLGFAREHGAILLQASTSEVYGDPDIHPQPESYHGNVSTIGPRACYDEGKRCAESLCMDYHRMHGMDIKIIRIFNTYGPRMAFDDGRVVSNFILQALKGEDITIYGDGSQSRSFCYVDDLVGGIIKMMNTPQGIMGPINLGNPDEFTITQLANIIIQKTNSNSTIIYKQLPEDDPKRRRPDITFAKEMLKWKPKISLEVGLEKTIKEFTERLSNQ